MRQALLRTHEAWLVSMPLLRSFGVIYSPGSINMSRLKALRLDPNPRGFDLTARRNKRKYQTSVRLFRRLQTYEFSAGHLSRRRFQNGVRAISRHRRLPRNRPKPSGPPDAAETRHRRHSARAHGRRGHENFSG